MRSFLKPYVKWYCYERLLASADTNWSSIGKIVNHLTRADQFILGRGFTTIDDIAPQVAFEELWAAHLTSQVERGARRTQAEIRNQVQSRVFWLRLRSYFGSPLVVPPIAPYVRRVPTEYADDKTKVIPEHVIKLLVNRLALHREGLAPLNRYNHLRLCLIILAICLGRRISEILSAPRGGGPDGPLGREPARNGPEQGALWFQYKPGKRGPSSQVYISSEWEDVATYCVRELVKYGDELRRRAHPREAMLLILVSASNLTAGQFSAFAAADMTLKSVENEADEPAVRGLREGNLRQWLNGRKGNKVFEGVLKQWEITVDGRPGGEIYKLGLSFFRHTRQSALALDPQISLFARQRDLNHNDTNAQFVYQHRLVENHEALLRKIGEGKMCGGGAEWFANLLGNKTSGFSEGAPRAMTPRWRALVKNNPLFLQINRVPCGLCVLPKGPGGCPAFLNCTGAEEGGCPCFVIDCDDARMLAELNAKTQAERRRQLESAAAGRTVQAGKHEVQARRVEGLRDEAMRLASAERLAELHRLQDEFGEEDIWGDA